MLMNRAVPGVCETHGKDVVKPIPCSHKDILVLGYRFFQHPPLCLGALTNLDHVAFCLEIRQQ